MAEAGLRAALVIEGGTLTSGLPRDGSSLRARLDAAIGWVERHCHAFDPFHGDRAYRATLGQRSSELGVALYVHASIFPSERRRLEPLVAYLDRVRRQPELAHRVVRNPGEFVLGADLYGLLRLLGKEDASHRELLQRAVDAGFLDHVERHPHRELDVRLALEWAGLSHPWPSIEDIVRRSPLVRSPPSPLFLDEAAVYALTHIVLFATDFGIAGERLCRADTLVPLAAVVPTLAVAACVDRHWDLVGELLICHDALDLPRNELWREVWDAFLGQQLENGAFPGPEAALEKDVPEERPPTPDELEEAHIAHCYHTTLIGWIAIANRMARDRSATRPERDIPTLTVLPRSSAASRSSSMAGADVVEVAVRSRAWLHAALVEVNASEPTVGEACSVVLGLELCERLAGRGSGPEPIAAFRHAARIIDGASSPGSGGAEAGVTSRLLAGAVLLSRGVDLPAYLHLLPDVASLLRGEDEGVGDRRTDPAVRHARSLLACLELCDPPEDPDGNELEDAFRQPLVARDRDDLVALIGRIESACGWGTRTPRDAARLDHDAILQALAVAALRHLDMELGCRIVRTLVWLGRDVDRSGWADYLRFHNRPDGAFGFFGPEARSLRASGDGGDGARVAVRRLEIATTVTCLWTLAELTQEWSFPACLVAAGDVSAESS